ncbi:MAG TPA: N-acylneuraminate cytidylyltransferase [Anaerolineaceae bacterium]|nr:N-acylneuraminate cytidylyltransferase [Anaerolineales bacterium]HIQ08954.1 N-acylneuraminate cytidylyltransferase [Anaerolineaceae bacterium]
MTEVLALIPARGGSKSIPRKNIKPFLGYPLLAYSIAAGLQAETVTRVVVSTDDEEIAAVAREYGAEVPFLRPAHLAQDATPDLPVFVHALQWLAEHEGFRPEVVVQLRPTTPVRPPGMVDKAVRLLRSRPEADSVRGVVPSGQNPYKMWRIAPDGTMRPLLDLEGVAEPYNAPRQSLPPTYWQTGHIDAIRARTLLEKGSMSGQVILPLVLDPAYTVDLDTPLDWLRAESLVRTLGLSMVWPGKPKRPWPRQVRLLVLDFDGTLTDNRVWVDETGREMVAAHRGDGMGIALIRRAGVEVVILSTERNPVVAARARKLGVPVFQGVEDKPTVLRRLLAERGVPAEQVVYVGNDVNDVPCFPLVGFAAVPADAHLKAKRAADEVLRQRGGRGAVREICDRILQQKEQPGG